jgi:hypothetical protein
MNQGTKWVLLMKKKNRSKKSRASVPLNDLNHIRFFSAIFCGISGEYFFLIFIFKYHKSCEIFFLASCGMTTDILLFFYEPNLAEEPLLFFS